MDFLTLAVIWAATFVLGEVLRPVPKLERPKPGRVEPPTSEVGGAVPVVFGTCKVSCNVGWYDTPTSAEVGEYVRTGLFRRQWQVTGHKYFIPMQTIICHGCVDALIDIYFADFRLSQYSNTSIQTITKTPLGFSRLPSASQEVFYIDAPNLFGGTASGQGGVQGEFEFFWGTNDQLPSTFIYTPPSMFGPSVVGATGTTIYGNLFGHVGIGSFGIPNSPLKNICHAVFRSTIMGMSPYLKPIYWVVRRCPFQLTDPITANVEGDANPAEVAYEILTDTLWGLSMPDSLIDKGSFIEAAHILKEEETGYSQAWANQVTGEEMLQDVLRHADMLMFENPFTGLLTLKLIRDDYNVEDLYVFDEDNSFDLEFSRSSWKETINEVKLRYTRRDMEWNTEVAQAQNLASTQAIGEVRTETYDYAGISRAEQAQRQAESLLRLSSIPLAKAEFKCNRQGVALKVGDPFILSWPKLGIEELVMRVLKIDYGRLEDGKVQVNAIEDVFDVSGTAYSLPEGGAETITTTPGAVGVSHIMELPYAMSGADHEVGLFVRRPFGLYAGYEVHEDEVLLDTQDLFTAAARVATFDLYFNGQSHTLPDGFTVTLTRDLDNAADQGLALLLAVGGEFDGNHEIISYDGIEPLGEDLYRVKNVKRGLMDTVPSQFAKNAHVFFLTNMPEYGPFTLVEELSFKFLPFNDAGTLALSDAPVVAHEVYGRTLLPLPPGNVRLNGNGYDNWPASMAGGDAVLTWSHRNRSEVGSTLIEQDDATDYTLEGDVTVEAWVFDVPTGAWVLVRTWDEITTGTVTWTAAEMLADAAENHSTLRFKITPVDGSLVGHSRYTPMFTRGSA